MLPALLSHSASTLFWSYKTDFTPWILDFGITVLAVAVGASILAFKHRGRGHLTDIIGFSGLSLLLLIAILTIVAAITGTSAQAISLQAWTAEHTPYKISETQAHHLLGAETVTVNDAGHQVLLNLVPSAENDYRYRLLEDGVDR